MSEKVIQQSIKTFNNLLKEFPKNAADDFIYDDSTINKIGLANESLKLMSKLTASPNNALEQNVLKVVKESIETISKLMKELPESSEDEFLYDRNSHQLVENARGSLTKLNSLFPG